MAILFRMMKVRDPQTLRTFSGQRRAISSPKTSRLSTMIPDKDEDAHDDVLYPDNFDGLILFEFSGFYIFSRIWSKTGDRFPSHARYKYQEAIAWSADGNRSRRSIRFYISRQFQTTFQNLYQ